MTRLPTLYDLVYQVDLNLSAARDLINSDTVDSVEGRVTVREADQLKLALKAIGEAKFHLREAKRLVGERVR